MVHPRFEAYVAFLIDDLKRALSLIYFPVVFLAHSVLSFFSMSLLGTFSRNFAPKTKIHSLYHLLVPSSLFTKSRKGSTLLYTAIRTMSEFKLKSITSLPARPGDKVEVEVEDIEGAKVLLVNAAGKVQAIGPKCTHYGAPLAKGVLTTNGRIRCPWHGGMERYYPPSQ